MKVYFVKSGINVLAIEKTLRKAEEKKTILQEYFKDLKITKEDYNKERKIKGIKND